MTEIIDQAAELTSPPLRIAVDSSKHRNLPRRPQRKRGIARFEAILDAAHDLLGERKTLELSHQDLADRIGCATATVYHLFPSMNAVFSALSDRYAKVWVAVASRVEPVGQFHSWQDMFRQKFDECRAHYNKTPQALLLFIGPNMIPEVRIKDRALNKTLGDALLTSMEPHFEIAKQSYLSEKLANAIEISDTFWSLSVARHGLISDELAEEAFVAIFAYLETFIPQYLPVRC